MKIDLIKAAMLDYRDIYGGELFGSDKIEKARTKRQLADIIDKHNDHMCDVLQDAESNLRSFKRKLELPYF